MQEELTEILEKLEEAFELKVLNRKFGTKSFDICQRLGRLRQKSGVWLQRILIKVRT